MLAGSHGWGKSGAIGLPPRPLAMVALRPLISYALDWFRDARASNVIVCASDISERLNACLGDNYDDLALSYVGASMPRGPAGSIRDAERVLYPAAQSGREGA